MKSGYQFLKSVADEMGISALLQKLGLAKALGKTVRLCLDSKERADFRQIRADYLNCRHVFEALSGAIPQGSSSSPVWLIGSMNTVWGMKLEAVLGLAMRVNGFRPVGVCPGRWEWRDRYHAACGIKERIDFQEFIRSTPDDQSESSWRFGNGRPSMQDLMRMTYRNVDVGRIAVSNLMYKRKFSKFNLSDDAIVHELRDEVHAVERRVRAAEKMVQSSRPSLALILEKGISPFAEIFGACIANGVPVVQYVGSQEINGYIFKRYSSKNRHDHPFSLDETTWSFVKDMPWTEEQESSFLAELEESYRHGTWFNRRFLHDDKLIKGADEVRRQLGLDPKRKTAVVFSHVLWDATIFYGEALFDDYEAWLVETVSAACENTTVNWVIKLHPDLVWKLKYEGFAGELRDAFAIRSKVGRLPEHVKLILPDTDINTFSFFGMTDYCLTVRGTIGIEMACMGVPVLTAGTGRYSGLGFTIDSDSAKEYLDRVRYIHEIPPMSAQAVELARRFAYSLFRLRPWRMQSFEMVKMPLEKTGHPLERNLLPRFQRTCDFAKAPDVVRFAMWLASDRVDFIDLAT
jgi:hypothetical protein